MPSFSDLECSLFFLFCLSLLCLTCVNMTNYRSKHDRSPHITATKSSFPTRSAIHLSSCTLHKLQIALHPLTWGESCSLPGKWERILISKFTTWDQMGSWFFLIFFLFPFYFANPLNLSPFIEQEKKKCFLYRLFRIVTPHFIVMNIRPAV